MSSFQQKNHKAYKRKEKYGPLKETKYTSRNGARENSDVGLIRQRLKTTVLKMLQVLMDDINKDRKMMYEKNEKINRERNYRKEK